MGKSILQELESKVEGFTHSQRKVADYILKYPTEAAFLTIEQLAGLTGVSVATVMRLAYSIGHTGFSQFQKELQEVLRSRVAPPNRLEANVKKISKNKLLIDCAQLQIENIRKTVEFLSEEKIDQAFQLIAEAKKVYVIGIRGSSAVANCLTEGLNRLGVDCEQIVPDTVRSQAICARLSSNDLVIAVSLPRYARRTVEISRIAKKRQAKLLAITDGYSSPLALIADVFLGCAFESRAFHHSEIGALFVADFLVTGIAVKNSHHSKQQLEDIEKVVKDLEANVIE